MLDEKSTDVMSVTIEAEAPQGQEIISLIA